MASGATSCATTPAGSSGRGLAESNGTGSSHGISLTCHARREVAGVIANRPVPENGEPGAGTDSNRIGPPGFFQSNETLNSGEFSDWQIIGTPVPTRLRCGMI